MRHLSFRLKPGEKLKERIEQVARDEKIKAGALLSIVGSLSTAVLRMAGATPKQQQIKTWQEDFEIVGGTGTIAESGCYIHVSLSNTQGSVIGGHLKDGCVVKSTAEIVLAIFDDVEFQRVRDSETGYPELKIV